MGILMLLVILAFRALNSTSVIDAVYTIASYTYGPLLGLFAFGLFNSRRQPRGRLMPFICILAPVLCYVLSTVAAACWNYHFSYELLLLNGLLTILGLYLSSLKSQRESWGLEQ